MRRRKFIAVFAVTTAAWPLGTRAQQGGKVYKIGVLSAGSSETGGDPSWLMPSGSWDTSRQKPHIRAPVCRGPAPPAPRRQRHRDEPHGARSRRKAAGTAQRASTRNFSRGVLWNAANPYSALVFKETAGAAQTLGVELQSLEIREPPDLDAALEAATAQHADALITVEDPLTSDLRKKIAEFAANHRLPTVSGLRVFADSEFLITYGADLADINRRSVVYVDKILKGAKPSDLPVEQPTKFELVLNLKTAKELGNTIPALLLARADEVIE
jgi:hypothetical protein